MAKEITALNTVSGVVAKVPAIYLTLPVLGDNLVEVPEGTKSYDPKLYKPTDAKGHSEKPTTQNKLNDKEKSDDTSLELDLS